MKKARVLTVLRNSYVDPLNPSRSLFERVLEPLSLLEDDCIEHRQIAESAVSEVNVHNYDILYLSRHKTETIRRLAEGFIAAGKQVIYDLDDLVTQFPRNNIANWSSKDISTFHNILTLSTTIVLANDSILSHLPEELQKKAIVIPTGIRVNEDLFLMRKDPKGVVFVNGDNLKFGFFKKALFETLRSFSEEIGEPISVYADTEVEFAGEFPYISKGTFPSCDFRKILAAESYKFGISPLASTEDPAFYEFNVCKSPVKYLLYGSLGIPCIYSNNPIYTSVVENEVTGLIVANTIDAWTGALRRLSHDSDLREKISKNSFESVYRNFNLETMSNKIKHAIFV